MRSNVSYLWTRCRSPSMLSCLTRSIRPDARQSEDCRAEKKVMR